MRRRRLVIAATALALGIGACGGDEDAERGGTPAPETSPAPGALPPAFLQCMADQGYPIDSPDQIHSAPQQVLQTCFGELHEGGASPPR